MFVTDVPEGFLGSTKFFFQFLELRDLSLTGFFVFLLLVLKILPLVSDVQNLFLVLHRHDHPDHLNF